MQNSTLESFVAVVTCGCIFVELARTLAVNVLLCTLFSRLFVAGGRMNCWLTLTHTRYLYIQCSLWRSYNGQAQTVTE